MRQQHELPDENSTVEALLRAHPGAARVLLRHGMACVGCAMAPHETVAQAAREYRVHLGTILEELGIAAAARPRRPRSTGAGHETRGARRRAGHERQSREGKP